ncbi:MAG: hypothetical protein ACR2I5_10385 [Candidatus Limnocylindria bacterium]
MLVSLALLVLLVGGSLPPADAPSAISALPDEPGSVVLPDAPILQSVAADIDGDGRREIVRLIRGPDDSVLAEAWTEGPQTWSRMGEAVEAVPPSRIGARIDPVYLATPVQLLVRHVDGAERVTIAIQPHFEQIDVGPPCCLVLHDLGARDGALVRLSVADPSNFADALLVIDLDGDGTDELLSTQSLPPLGDLEFPTLARVHRWSGDAFGRPTETRLSIGSGLSPILLGDSDGLPGDEAAILSGPPGPRQMYRLQLGDADTLVVDAGGVAADGAIAIERNGGRGVAFVNPIDGLVLARWPAGGLIADATVGIGVRGARIVGAVSATASRIVIHDPGTEALHLLDVSGGAAPAATTVTRSPAAATLSETPLSAFSGPIPGGGVDAEPAVIHQGRLIPSPFGSEFDATSVISSLAGAQPVGLVGDRDLVALDHAPRGLGAGLSAGGGPLIVPPPREGSWTSIAPLTTVAERELDDGLLDPPVRNARVLDGRGTIAVGAGGFVAEIVAPPGSRIFVGDADPSVIRAPIVVPADGLAAAPFVPPNVGASNPRYRATLIVQTPSGRAYLADWDVRVRNEAPELSAMAVTPIGSGAVEVSGRTAPGTEVSIDGRPVTVDDDGRFSGSRDLPPWPTDVVIEADDGLGNQARRVVTAVGWLDYRGLPWVPITGLLVAAVGLVLFLRVPRSSPLPRRPDDDAAYEEMDLD